LAQVTVTVDGREFHPGGVAGAIARIMAEKAERVNLHPLSKIEFNLSDTEIEPKLTPRPQPLDRVRYSS
jgi:hypothetical protein